MIMSIVLPLLALAVAAWRRRAAARGLVGDAEKNLDHPT